MAERTTGEGCLMAPKFRVTHLETGREVPDAFPLVPARDMAAWLAARVYAEFCAPELAQTLLDELDRVWAHGIVVGGQGKANEPHCEGGRDALELFFQCVRIVRAGRLDEVQRFLTRLDQEIPTPSLVGQSAAPTSWDAEVTELLATYAPGDVFTAEQVVRRLKGTPANIARCADDELLRRVVTVMARQATAGTVEMYGQMTYRTREKK